LNLAAERAADLNVVRELIADEHGQPAAPLAIALLARGDTLAGHVDDVDLDWLIAALIADAHILARSGTEGDQL